MSIPAQERAWESGYYWEFHPAWNCTVMDSADNASVHNASASAQRWSAVLREAVLESESATCKSTVRRGTV